MSALRMAGFAGLAAVVIGGAGFFALQPRAEPLNANGCYSERDLNRYFGFSDWVDLTRTRQYRVDWSPKTMRCDAAARTADVTVQLTHGTPQRNVSQVDTGPTIITQDLFYTRERLQLFFDCGKRQMALVERRLMSEGETVARVIDERVDGKPKLEPYEPDGLGLALDEEVCNIVNRVAGAS